MDLDQFFLIKDYNTITVEVPRYRSDGDNNNNTTEVPPLSIELECSQAASTDYDLTGQILWPVSVLLSYYLASEKGQERIQDKNVVELGAGCGLAGLVAAQFAKAVVTTDGNEIVMDLLQRNAEKHERELQSTINSEAKLLAKEFQWGDQRQLQDILHSLHGHADVIVAADVVQWPDVLEPLVHSAKAMLWTSHAKEPVFIIGIVNRAQSTYQMFFDLAEDNGLSWRKVAMEEFLKDGEVPKECQESGGRKTEIYEVFLSDRSEPSVLLANTKA